MILRLILFALVVAWPAARAAEELKVNPYGKFFTGSGVEIEFAQLTAESKNGLKDVLLRIKGAEAFDAGIDGQVIRYTAVNGGNGVDYQYKNEDGDTRTRFISRKSGYGGDTYEVFFGNKTIRVTNDEKKAKEVKPAEMLAEFTKKK